MTESKGSEAPRRPHSMAVRILVLAAAALLVEGGARLTPVLVAANPPGFLDSDGDGLADAFEAYIAIASSDPLLGASPYNSDCDGDGQPDGFEYCLSERQEICSPGKVHPVVPKLVLGTHQEGNLLVLSLFLIPGELKYLEGFVLLAAAPSPATGQPVALDVTTILQQNIRAVEFVYWKQYKMAVLQATIPVATLEGFSSLALAPLGKIVGVKVGDSGTFTASGGFVQRWSFRQVAAAGGGNDGIDALGEAEPQDSENPPGAEPSKVCTSQDVRLPSQVPGVLLSVPMQVGCDGGTWTCVADVCSPTGAAGGPKVVLDHLLLLQ